MHKETKYNREIKPGTFVDVYDVLEAFNVTCPAIQHALKKMLVTGQRGIKSKGADLKEAVQALERAIELEQQRELSASVHAAFIESGENKVLLGSSGDPIMLDEVPIVGSANANSQLDGGCDGSVENAVESIKEDA